MSEPTLEATQHALAAILPNTEYFEIESSVAGARYGIWVNTPLRYAAEPDRRYPAIFTPDGNLLAPMLIPTNFSLSGDAAHPIQPFVQVCVGYCGDAVASWLWGERNRDLVPPGEPPSPAYLALIDSIIAAGGETGEQMTQFRAAMIDGGRADLFLRFLAEELYPLIAARWRIDTSCSGFFGTSYGGLFASWAAMQRPSVFTRIGAGSPGINTDKSKVFELLNRDLESGADHSGRHLHLSIGETEFTAASIYQMLGAYFGKLTFVLGNTPLKGLKVTSLIVAGESHTTSIPGQWFGFLRACYSTK